jgi:cyclic-di-GMP phosphodiesterase TipF (flagellum assembly factor)
VFSAFSGESVADEHFLGELAETLHQRASLASQLVLSFTQTDVRGFSTRSGIHWPTCARSDSGSRSRR